MIRSNRSRALVALLAVLALIAAACSAAGNPVMAWGGGGWGAGAACLPGRAFRWNCPMTRVRRCCGTALRASRCLWRCQSFHRAVWPWRVWPCGQSSCLPGWPACLRPGAARHPAGRAGHDLHQRPRRPAPRPGHRRPVVGRRLTPSGRARGRVVSAAQRRFAPAAATLSTRGGGCSPPRARRWWECR